MVRMCQVLGGVLGIQVKDLDTRVASAGSGTGSLLGACVVLVRVTEGQLTESCPCLSWF